MKLAILCLCLASTASAAPSPFYYTNYHKGPRQQAQNPFSAGQPLQQAALGGYSVELIFPQYPATGGSNVLPSHGFLKISVPQPPGRQSVEVYYPYDFTQQRIITNMVPMTNNPQGFPFTSPFLNNPQQALNNPQIDPNPLPSKDPMRPLQQDQAAQTNQMPAKM